MTSLAKIAVLALTALVSAPAFAQEMSMFEMPDPETSGYAEVNGIELWYETYGAGEPLVLLHGGLGTTSMFAPILPVLAEGRRVIAVDLQGHGHTPLQDRPMSLEAWGDDIAALITELGYEQADIMGYSTGADVALRAAIRHPRVVDRLVVVSTAFAFEGWHEYNQQGMLSMGSDLAEMMKQSPMYAAYAEVAPNPEEWPELLDRFGAITAQDYDWREEVAKLEMPVMLVAGDWDAVNIEHLAKFFALLGGGIEDAQWDKSAMNDNRLAVLAGLTHYDIFMSPELAETVIPFLDAE